MSLSPGTLSRFFANTPFQKKTSAPFFSTLFPAGPAGLMQIP
jgi:hypothetical protein